MTTIRTRQLKVEDLPAELRKPLEPLVRPINEFMGDVRSILNGGIGEENQANFVTEITVKMGSDWRDLSMIGGWQSVSNPRLQARWVPGGNLQIRGTVQGTSGPSFQIPSDLAIEVGQSFQLNNGWTLTTSTSGACSMSGTSGSADICIQVPLRDGRPRRNPSFPVTFKNTLPVGRPPKNVIITSIQDVTDASTSGPSTCWSVPVWKISGDNIQIEDIQGLTAGRTYKVTLTVSG